MFLVWHCGYDVVGFFILWWNRAWFIRIWKEVQSKINLHLVAKDRIQNTVLLMKGFWTEEEGILKGKWELNLGKSKGAWKKVNVLPIRCLSKALQTVLRACLSKVCSIRNPLLLSSHQKGRIYQQSPCIHFLSTIGEDIITRFGNWKIWRGQDFRKIIIVLSWN